MKKSALKVIFSSMFLVFASQAVACPAGYIPCGEQSCCTG